MDITILADNITQNQLQSDLEQDVNNKEWEDFQEKFQSEVIHTSAKQNEKKDF